MQFLQRPGGNCPSEPYHEGLVPQLHIWCAVGQWHQNIPKSEVAQKRHAHLHGAQEGLLEHGNNDGAEGAVPITCHPGNLVRINLKSCTTAVTCVSIRTHERAGTRLCNNVSVRTSDHIKSVATLLQCCRDCLSYTDNLWRPAVPKMCAAGVTSSQEASKAYPSHS